MVDAARVLEALSPVGRGDLRRILDAEAARRSLAEFLRQAWAIHHPRQALEWGWHLDAIADHLEAVTRGEITRLIINIPPRTLKSYLVSVCWPAWEWIADPGLQYIATSAIEKVVLRDALRHRGLCQSPWYQEAFKPDWSFDKEQDAKGYFINTAAGHRLSATIAASVTGQDCDRLLVDDPLDAKDAYGDKRALTIHVRNFDSTFINRLNDEKASAVVVIMQRLHERDLSGHLLELGGYEHLCLPAQFDGRRKVTGIGWTDPRKAEGELLFPARLPLESLERRKVAIGSRAFACQFQQTPSPEGGSVFREAWFNYWADETLPEMDFVIGSWDCTFTKSDDSDFVVGQTWGAHGADRYLLDQTRAKMNLTDTLDAIREQARLWPGMRAVVVEVKANGPKVIKTLTHEIPNLAGFDPQNSSKEQRANAVTPTFEAGQVYIPRDDLKPFVRDSFKPEILSFPNAAHDDQVDAMTQALIWINENGDPKPWIARL